MKYTLQTEIARRVGRTQTARSVFPTLAKDARMGHPRSDGAGEIEATTACSVQPTRIKQEIDSVGAAL
jgi:hypothetical protein